MFQADTTTRIRAENHGITAHTALMAFVIKTSIGEAKAYRGRELFGNVQTVSPRGLFDPPIMGVGQKAV